MRIYYVSWLVSHRKKIWRRNFRDAFEYRYHQFTLYSYTIFFFFFDVVQNYKRIYIPFHSRIDMAQCVCFYLYGILSYMRSIYVSITYRKYVRTESTYVHTARRYVRWIFPKIIFIPLRLYIFSIYTHIYLHVWLYNSRYWYRNCGCFVYCTHHHRHHQHDLRLYVCISGELNFLNI